MSHLPPQGQMVDDWWPLSGQEGEEKEGLLHLILSVQPLPPGSAVRLPPGGVAQNVTGTILTIIKYGDSYLLTDR